MKILISNDNYGAHYYIRLGLARAFVACGHEVIIWDLDKKPVNDAFDEFEPDIFLSQTYNLKPSIIRAIKERPHLKVICKASDWGPIQADIDLEAYPILTANQVEIDRIFKLKEETGQPEHLHIHYHPDYIEETHGYWIKSGIQTYSQLSAADIFDYTNGESRPEFKCNLMFIGGYWPYKAQVLDRYLLPLCKDFRVKIYGSSRWPVDSYCGALQEEHVKHAMASATICPNLSEPHSQAFGFDIIERPYKLLSNKCFVISDYVAGLENLYPSGIVYANTPQQFRERIEYYLQNPDERHKYIENGFKITMENHTYFHRVANIFERLGYKAERQRAIECYPNILDRLGVKL